MTRTRRARSDSRWWLMLLPPMVLLVVWSGSVWHGDELGAAPVQLAARQPTRQPIRPSYLRPIEAEPTPAILALANPEARAVNLEELQGAHAMIRHLEMRTAYPLWTQPLEPANIYQPPHPYRGIAQGQAGVELAVWPARSDFAPGEPVMVFAQATRDAQVLPLVGVHGETREYRDRPRIAFDLHDDGQDGDERAGDGVFTGRIALPDGRDKIGEWAFGVSAEIDGNTLAAESAFQIAALDAEIRGNYRIAKENGSLALYVDLNVLRPGFEHLRAELWAGETPIAEAWHAETVGPGSTTYRVAFYGKVIRDMGIDGPYTVRHLVLTTDSNAGRFAAPAVDPVITTAPYRADEFTDAPKNGDSALLQEQLRLARAQLGQAERGEIDPDNPSPPRTTSLDKATTPIPE